MQAAQAMGVPLSAKSEQLAENVRTLSEEQIEQLKAMGHRVEVDGTGAPFGGYQAIMRLPDGVYVGATEMRKDGTVVAW